MTKYKSLVGKKIGRLTVIELSNDKFDSNGTTRLWKCKCDCGNIVYKSARHLNYAIKLNQNLGCGCGNKINIVGNKYGDCTVISLAYIRNGTKLWNCRCICGDIIVRTHEHLKTRGYKCARIRKEKNRVVSKIRNVLYGMKKRCYDIKEFSYKHYGARGIKICDEWLNHPNNFVEWALKNGYKEGLSIDRINNDGNYEPSNCRWVDDFVQANNKRNLRNISYNGKTQSLRKWCRELGLPYRKTHKRLYMYGWSINKCFDEKERVGFI